MSAFYSVFTTRIMINLRRAGKRDTVGDLVELHVGWDSEDTPPTLMPLTFRRSLHVSHGIESTVSL